MSKSYLQSEKVWTLAALLSFAFLSLSLLFFSRKPLCLNTRLVDKMERLGAQSKEQVFKCDLNRTIPYSIYWRENLQSLNLRLQRLESALSLFSVPDRGLQVVVFKEKENIQILQGNTVYISENLLEKDGLFESLIVQGWLREMNPGFFEKNSLLVEALTENFLYSAYGEKSFEKIRTEKRQNRNWFLQVATASSEGCIKKQRLTDKFNLCLDGSQPLWMDTQKFAVQSWMVVFKSLPWNEKIPFLKELIQIVKRVSVDPLKDGTLEGDLQKANESPEEVAHNNLKLLISVLAQSNPGTEDVLFQKFLVRLGSLFQKEGLQDIVEDATLSLVYFVEEELTKESSLYLSMMELSRKNPNEKIAMLDQKKVWFFPSGLSLPRESLRWVKSKKMVFQTCRSLNMSQIQQFAVVSDRFLLIKNCDSAQVPLLAQFLKKGAEGFALQNPNLAFVHFHLPSLMMKKDKVNPQQDIFELLSRRQVASQQDSISTVFGWQQLEWKKDLQAYSPRAYVDAINLFRTPTRL